MAHFLYTLTDYFLFYISWNLYLANGIAIQVILQNLEDSPQLRTETRVESVVTGNYLGQFLHQNRNGEKTRIYEMSYTNFN